MGGWDDEYENRYKSQRTPRQKSIIRLGAMAAVAVMLIALVVAVLSCLSDNRSDRLENSVRGYTAEILGGDTNKAFERLSTRCQNHGGRHLYTEAWTAVRKQWTGSPGIRSYSASIEGDRAEVTYRFENPVWDQEKEAWIWESDKWVNDEC